MESKTAENQENYDFSFYLNNIKMENELVLNLMATVTFPGNVIVTMIHVTDKPMNKL